MALIATPGSILLRDVLLSIGVDDFRKQVSSVTLTPTSSDVTWQGLSPDATVTDTAPTTWTVTVDFAQDWQSEASLANYLHENEGEKVPMVFEPVAGGTSFSCAWVTLKPGTIGGAVGTQATASVTMPCAKPVRTAAPVIP